MHVRRLNIPMNDPFLMRVLDRLADFYKQLRVVPLRTLSGSCRNIHCERDRRVRVPWHEIRASIESVTLRRRARLSDIRVVHQSQSLALCLESGQSTSLRIHGPA